MSNSKYKIASVPFTMVEIFATIAIIFILASFLLPALSKGREMAHKVNCASNLKQLGNIIHLYQDDFGDWPDGNFGVWNALTASSNMTLAILLSGERSLYLCPSNQKHNTNTWPGATPYGLSGKTFFCDYMINNYVSGGAFAYDGAESVRIQYPARTVLLLDGAGEGGNFCVVYDIYTEFYTDGSTNRQRLGTPHRNNMNILYLDNHVSLLGTGDVPDASSVAPGSPAFMKFWDPLSM